MTFKKLFILNNVLHGIDISKNLMFSLLLSRNSFQMVFENDNLS